MLVFPSSVRFFAAALMAAVVGTASAYGRVESADTESAQDRGIRLGPAKPGAVRELRALLDTIEASEAQRMRVRSLMLVAESELRLHREAMAALQAEHRRATAADAAASVQRKILAQQDWASRRHLALMLDVSRLLTADQRARLATHAEPERSPADLRSSS